MYTIILFYIIGYFIFLYVVYKDFEELDAFVIFFPLLPALLISMVGFLIAIALPVKYKTSIWSENIIALKDNNSIQGSFFLGSGMINGKMEYIYYVQNDDSTYQMWQADYYKVKIRYTNNQPKAVITDTRIDDITWNKWAVDVDREDNQTYIFEIPRGSIKNNFELDSK